MNNNELKLIYVLKIGYNSKHQGLYEFIFSKNPTNIDYEEWGWNLEPACDNANPPTDDYVDAVYSLQTDSFDLFCLHEAVDREYMHGYYNIHCLAYEKEREEDNYYDEGKYDNIFDQLGAEDEEYDENGIDVLVFHYGMSLDDVEKTLIERDIILRKNQFIQSKNIKISN
jgi:hypothetical protein